MLMLYAAVIDDAEDIKKFEKIYYEYREQMFFVANKILRDSYEAEDAVQNALLGIARNIRTLPDDDACLVRAYTLTAAKNAALNMLPEKQRRDKMLHIDTVDEHNASYDESAFDRIAASEDVEMLSRAMSRMPDIYRDVLLLHCVCGLKVGQAELGIGTALLDYGQTADVLGRKKTTVDKQLGRARKLLVRFCAEDGVVFEHGKNKAGV